MIDRGPDAEKLLFRLWISTMPGGPITGHTWASKAELDKVLWESDSKMVEIPGCVDDLEQPVVCQILRELVVGWVASPLTKRMVQPVQNPNLPNLVKI